VLSFFFFFVLMTCHTDVARQMLSRHVDCAIVTPVGFIEYYVP